MNYLIFVPFFFFLLFARQKKEEKENRKKKKEKHAVKIDNLYALTSVFIVGFHPTYRLFVIFLHKNQNCNEL